MIPRTWYLDQLGIAVGRSPVTALLGPQQCGKTTLARIFGQGIDATYFDLESQPDVRRLQNPELVLGPLNDLKLDHLWVIYPGRHRYPVDDKITVIPLGSIHKIA